MTEPGAADPAAIAKAREALREKLQQIEPGQQPEVAGNVAPANPESLDKAREAVRERVQEQEAMQPDTAMQRSTARRGPTAMNFPPLEGPALPISTGKQQQLHELLQRYKADQITPEQYQSERAKILSQQ